MKEQRTWKSKGAIKDFYYGSQGRFVRHKATGEVMILLLSGDSYGTGDMANVERFNAVTGTYERIKVSRVALEYVEEEEDSKT